MRTGRSGAILREWDVPGGTVYAVAFHPGGRSALLATGSADRTVRIWDWKTSKELPLTSLQHAGRVTSVAYSRDGKRQYAVRRDKWGNPTV